MIGVVVGVTPDRWVRVWRERLPDVPLRIVPVDDVREALRSGVVMAFARLPLGGRADDEVHAIPLWDETPVVVAAKSHPVKLFDAVTEADIADEELYPGWDESVLDIVAAGHGIARMPQSVLRATGRRDVVARPISDAEPTRVGLVWLRTTTGELVDEFIGIVRGRTANSSRGIATEPAPKRAEPKRPDPRKPARPEAKRAGRPSKPRTGKRHR